MSTRTRSGRGVLGAAGKGQAGAAKRAAAAASSAHGSSSAADPFAFADDAENDKENAPTNRAGSNGGKSKASDAKDAAVPSKQPAPQRTAKTAAKIKAASTVSAKAAPAAARASRLVATAAKPPLAPISSAALPGRDGNNGNDGNDNDDDTENIAPAELHLQDETTAALTATDPFTLMSPANVEESVVLQRSVSGRRPFGVLFEQGPCLVEGSEGSEGSDHVGETTSDEAADVDGGAPASPCAARDVRYSLGGAALQGGLPNLDSPNLSLLSPIPDRRSTFGGDDTDLAIEADAGGFDHHNTPSSGRAATFGLRVDDLCGIGTGSAHGDEDMRQAAASGQSSARESSPLPSTTAASSRGSFSSRSNGTADTNPLLLSTSTSAVGVTAASARDIDDDDFGFFSWAAQEAVKPEPVVAEALTACKIRELESSPPAASPKKQSQSQEDADTHQHDLATANADDADGSTRMGTSTPVLSSLDSATSSSPFDEMPSFRRVAERPADPFENIDLRSLGRPGGAGGGGGGGGGGRKGKAGAGGAASGTTSARSVMAALKTSRTGKVTTALMAYAPVASKTTAHDGTKPRRIASATTVQRKRSTAATGAAALTGHAAVAPVSRTPKRRRSWDKDSEEESSESSESSEEDGEDDEMDGVQGVKQQSVARSAPALVAPTGSAASAGASTTDGLRRSSRRSTSSISAGSDGMAAPAPAPGRAAKKSRRG